MTSLDPVQAHVETLLQDWPSSRRPPGLRLARLHQSGDTSALLPPEQMSRLADAVPGPRRSLLADGPGEIGIDDCTGDGLARAQAAGRLRRNFHGNTDDATAVRSRRC